jgi:hypothetical protein
MSEQDVRDLWSAVNSMRAESALIGSSLVRIEAMLSERCEARMNTMRQMQRQTEDHDKRIDKLEQLRAQLLVIAAIGSMVGGAAVAWLFRVIGG